MEERGGAEYWDVGVPPGVAFADLLGGCLRLRRVGILADILYFPSGPFLLGKILEGVPVGNPCPWSTLHPDLRFLTPDTFSTLSPDPESPTYSSSDHSSVLWAASCLLRARKPVSSSKWL